MVASSAAAPETKTPPTLISWICMLILPLIPIVGTIGYIVCVCLKCFGKNEDKTVRSWARASLVVILVRIIITATICIILEARLGLFSLIFALVEAAL